MNRIRLWWKFEGRFYLKDMITGIKNLISWFLIIWKDRDWDYRYTYTVLKFKLKRQADYIEKNKRFVGWEFVVRDIRIAVKLLDLIAEGYYETEYFDYIDRDYYFLPIEGSTNSTLESTTTRDDLESYFNKYKRLYLKTKSDNRDLTAIRMGRKRHNKAKRLLFRILNEKLESWWD